MMRKIRLNIWTFIKKHGELFVFLFLIILISNVVWSDVNDINGFGKKIWHLRFFNHFFVDGNNKFNWIGITSALAIISLTFNAWDRRRQFRADLISKNRIVWLQDLKEIISNYSATYRDAVNLIGNLLELRVEYYEEEKNNPESSKLDLLRDNEVSMSDEYNRLIENSSKYIVLLNINLLKEDQESREVKLLGSAKKVMDSFKKLKELEDLSEVSMSDISNLKEIKKSVNQCIVAFEKESACYCKTEWERVKRAE